MTQVTFVLRWNWEMKIGDRGECSIVYLRDCDFEKETEALAAALEESVGLVLTVAYGSPSPNVVLVGPESCGLDGRARTATLLVEAFGADPDGVLARFARLSWVLSGEHHVAKPASWPL